MKKSRIIIPALGLIALGTAASITGTVAWFSMNTAVTVTGMTVHTQVSSNLQIAHDTLASTTRKDDSYFASSDSTDLGNKILEPVSSVNAKNFFYTVDAKADGDANREVYSVYNAAETPTSSELDDFNAAYSTTLAVGYVDYVFQLKAVNTIASIKDIKITRLDLIYGDHPDTSVAHRVGVLVEDLGESGSAPAGGSGTLKGIYAPTGFENQTSVTNSCAVSAANAVTELTNEYNVVGNIASVPASKTNYYKVVLRLWLEGEDKTCTSATFLDLTDNWKLNVEMKLDTSTTNTAVSNLAKYTSKQVTISAETKTYYYDGTYFWTDETKLGTESADRVAKASAPAEVKTAFGIA